jgi:hypothetical protein
VSINDIREKIKWGDWFWLVTIFLLVSLIFGLINVGLNWFKTNKLAQYPNQINILSLNTSILPGVPDPNGPLGVFVGSKTGKKYHLPSCSGAKRIIDKNKIWFASAIEAEKLGYTPATNCPGLK